MRRVSHGGLSNTLLPLSAHFRVRRMRTAPSSLPTVRHGRGEEEEIVLGVNGSFPPTILVFPHEY
mgnify:CR=1 FL=1